VRNKKHNGYNLDEEQVVFLRQLRLIKEYKKVPPDYKGMVTMSINRKKIINDKHLNGVKQALKIIDNKLVKIFGFPKLSKRKNKKIKRNTKPNFIIIRPFREIYIKDNSLTKQENHEKYLKSGIWKRKRIFILKKRGCKCENCGYKPKEKSELHLHHKTYRKWGAEHQNHLKIMCKDCHSKLHDKYTITELEDLFSAGKNPKV